MSDVKRDHIDEEHEAKSLGPTHPNDFALKGKDAKTVTDRENSWPRVVQDSTDEEYSAYWKHQQPKD